MHHAPPWARGAAAGPRTGYALAARGVRSLTVFGPIPSLDADVLSTALFVAGPDAALAYARTHGLGLVIVDSSGRRRSYVPTSWQDIRLERERTS